MTIPRPNERYLPAAALITMAMAWGWAWRHPVRQADPTMTIAAGRIREQDGRAARLYLDKLNQSPAISQPADWEPPSPQPRGPEWVYDVFTPPEIYYDPRSQAFTVTPPRAPTAWPRGNFGLELVGVRPEPFRLQLAGFVGGEGSYLGMFEDAGLGGHLLARSGRHVPELGLTIREFTVQRVRAEPADGMTASELVATAVVHDDRTDEDFTLTNGVRCDTGVLLATVAPADAPEERHELRPGETLELGRTTYEIGQVHLDPPSAEVTRKSADVGEPETRTLLVRR